MTHGFGVFLRKSFWWGVFLGLLTDKEGRSSSEVKEEEEKKKINPVLSNRLAEDVHPFGLI